MESKIISKNNNTKEYPCLKYYKNQTDLVVLFYANKIGTVVADNTTDRVGEYSDIWKEYDFLPFFGTIELSN